MNRSRPSSRASTVPLRVLSLVAGLVMVSVCGCSSTKTPVADSLAAIEVKGRPPLDIARAVSETFQAAGYEPVPVPPGRGIRMVFEKVGSTGDTVLHGDWSMKKLWYRAKIEIESRGPEAYVVKCDAYRVFDHGESHFEEERKLTGIRRGAYQDLLDAAKAKLQP